MPVSSLLNQHIHGMEDREEYQNAREAKDRGRNNKNIYMSYNENSNNYI